MNKQVRRAILTIALLSAFGLVAAAPVAAQVESARVHVDGMY